MSVPNPSKPYDDREHLACPVCGAPLLPVTDWDEEAADWIETPVCPLGHGEREEE